MSPASRPAPARRLPKAWNLPKAVERSATSGSAKRKRRGLRSGKPSCVACGFAAKVRRGWLYCPVHPSAHREFRHG